MWGLRWCNLKSEAFGWAVHEQSSTAVMRSVYDSSVSQYLADCAFRSWFLEDGILAAGMTRKVRFEGAYRRQHSIDYSH
jgi:hypothetical protein